MFKPISDTRPENEILLCCARTSHTLEENVFIQSLIQKNIDWQYLIKMAQWHGLMPLVYKSLSSICPKAVPPAIMETLQKNYQANGQRNLFLTGELIRLLHLFNSNGIPAFPFKGPALAASVYSDLALRQFSDLDILVQKQDVLKARDLLVSYGYTLEFQFKEARAEALLKYQYDFPFAHKNGSIFVELHWELVPMYLNCSLVSKYLWEHFKPLMGSSGLPALPPEYSLLMLCIHGTKDFWRHLKCVCDVAESIRVHKDMDWTLVLVAAKEAGCRRMLFLGLFLAKDLLDAPLPDIVKRGIESDRVVKKLAKQVTQMLFNNRNSVPGLENLLFYLRSKELLTDQILHCFRMMTTISPRDWAFLPLPSGLFFLYYLLRPIRLIERYLLKISG